MARIIRKNNTVCADYPEGSVLFDLDSRTPGILNALAVEIWKWLRRPRALRELVILIARKYSIGQQQARKDIISLLGQLKEKGLVRDVKT